MEQLPNDKNPKLLFKKITTHNTNSYTDLYENFSFVKKSY